MHIMSYSKPSLLVYALIGILCLIPSFIIYAILIAIAVSQRWPEWIGPGINLLSWLVLGWAASALSGWICGRFSASREGIGSFASLFFANSSFWVSLVFLSPALGHLEYMESREFNTWMSIALFIPIIGYFITQWSFKCSKKQSEQKLTKETKREPFLGLNKMGKGE
jgi:hypothetical protein